MRCTLQFVSANATLAEIAGTIRQAEKRGFALLSLAAGRVAGRLGNLLILEPGAIEPAIHLVAVDGEDDVGRQQEVVDAAEQTGKRLICYAGVYVQGRIKNVAAYRADPPMP